MNKSSEVSLTPLMEQYFAVKNSYKDCLLFFRLGDFYELFFEDAEKASKELNIVLTKRGKKSNGDDIPMCGIPYHASESYIGKLVKSGFKIAICEQIESPLDAKKRGNNAIVKRDVIRIVTPGTLTEDSFLQTDENNYLLSVYKNLDLLNSNWIVSWVDISTSEFYVRDFDNTINFESFVNQLNPSEIIVSDDLFINKSFLNIKNNFLKKITPRPSFVYQFDLNTKQYISSFLKINDLNSLFDYSNDELICIKSLIDYIKLTNKCDTIVFKSLQKESSNEELFMDEFTFKSLEIISPFNVNNDWAKHYTIFDVVKETCSNVGTRLLKNMIMRPVTNIEIINNRLDAIEFFIKNQNIISDLRMLLKGIPDIQRILSRISFNRSGPRDLYLVLNYINILPKIKSVLSNVISDTNVCNIISSIIGRIDTEKYNFVENELSKSLKSSNLPILARDGGFIKSGYDLTLDEYNLLVSDVSNVILSLQSEYAKELNTSKLKIKHNNILGYFIELPLKSGDIITIDKTKFIHRQTTTNVIRYTTLKLSELDSKILNAQDKCKSIELEIFNKLCNLILSVSDDLINSANAIANLDVFSSFAMLSVRENYVRPIIDNSLAFEIIGGRHPVVEKNMKLKKFASFIDNDCILENDNNGNSSLWLVTGPNMAGKSTFLRQNAIIAMLAHSGFYVPATSAHIGVIDKLFSRVGASDSLATGQSTFMIEMVETASILNKATQKSFVILDEIGRGTSTFDGMSIAYGVVEYLCEKIKCRGLFATHYHELTTISRTYKNITCHSMQVKEWSDEIVFLYKIALGVAKRSYGIAVAKLAGIPKEVIEKAKLILSNLEQSNYQSDNDLFNNIENNNCVDYKEDYQNLIRILNDINPDLITPKEALEKLYSIKNLLK